MRMRRLPRPASTLLAREALLTILSLGHGYMMPIPLTPACADPAAV
jgi:hypothetical protein